MGRHSCSVKQKLRKGLWSPEEDEKLSNYITNFGIGSWSSVPKLAGNCIERSNFCSNNIFMLRNSLNMYKNIKLRIQLLLLNSASAAAGCEMLQGCKDAERVAD